MSEANEAGPAAPGVGGWRAEVAFLRRVLIVLGVVVLAVLLWTVRDALLLAFGAVVVAVLLLAGAEPLEGRFGLSRTWSLVAVGLALAAFLALAAVLVGSQVRAQVGTLGAQLPEAVRGLEQRLGVEVPWIGGAGPAGDAQRPARDGAAARAPGADGAPGATSAGGDARRDPAAPGGGRPPALGDAASVVGTVAQHAAWAGALVLDALSALVLAVVGAFFLAGDPRMYRRGLVALLPRSQRERADDALQASGRALRLWLRAQLLAMLIVGTLTGLGAWAIGLPAPLALGLVAALAEFVPLVGPVAAAVPALLLALGQGGGAVLWTLVLYLAVQQVESNMITPLLGKRMVDIPPALLLFAVVAAGAVLGVGGVLLAAPLTVVAFVLVNKLYVRETLGSPAPVPGEKA